MQFNFQISQILKLFFKTVVIMKQQTAAMSIKSAAMVYHITAVWIKTEF